VISPTYVYRAHAKRVLDGDTFIVNVDLGFEVWSAIRVRVRDIQAPELVTEAGELARDWALLTLLPISGPQRFTLRSFGRSFERWVCDVWLSDGASYADKIVEAGHAVRLK
jgi:micrococcal nuclease